MSPVSRRIFLYWVLLFVPTLAAGGGAILLLRREQARIAEQGAYADEARRAAIAARARLSVESVELLVGDVQTGLLDTLAEPRARDVEQFMEQWERSNPLVRMAFRVTAGGEFLRPDPAAANEEARGFLRRFSRPFQENPPWAIPPAPAIGTMPGEQMKRERDADEMRQDVTSNVAQVQSARRDVQQLFKAQELAVRGRTSEGSYAEDRRVPAASSAPANASAVDVGRAKERPMARNEAKSGAAYPELNDAAGRRGWWPTSVDGRLHLIAWVELPGGGEVRGVEVETAALLSRLESALPAAPGSGEGFVLRDGSGRIVHQRGAVPRNAEPVVRVPLAAALLPGWEVLGYFTAAPAGSAGGAGVFWLGALLAGVFVAAILAGGSLLLWQARRSEEEAAQKTSFVANVSHEFKTPLTTIRLYSELLEQGRVRDGEQGRAYLRTIGRETQRLARLVNNALDFSRLEQGRKKYAREEIDLGAEIGRLLDTHAPRVTEAGLRLERNLPATPVSVMADRDALEQIVLNLIDNACKYAADGGQVAVTVAKPRDGQSGGEVRVSDRGPGVPAEQRGRIFEKFHRVDDALTAEKTGAGLGLSIARQLARGLGGELRYVAREGGGAEFVLELP